MDNVGSSNDQKELTISLAASSMINASDVIPPETYQGNLKRIQDIKEIVRRLEMNNEAAHRNYIVDQLEKRAHDGREAEEMLARLKNQPVLPETVQIYNNNTPVDKSDILLPTTATLVEVPESHSSPSYSPTTSHTSQAVQPGPPAGYQWNPPQIQPYYPDFRYYVPQPTTGQHHRNSAVPHSRIHDAAQVNWYSAQNMPAQPGIHNYQSASQQTRTQQSSQSRNGYPHQIPDSVPGYYSSLLGWNRTAPANNSSSTNPSNPTYRFPAQSTLPQPAGTTYTQSQNLSATSPQVQVPVQGVPLASAKIPSGRPPNPVDPQPRPTPTTVSKRVSSSEPQRLHEPPQHTQRQQQQQQPQRLPQFSLQPGQHSRQPQQPPQAPLRAQQPPQPPPNIQPAPHSVDCLSSADVSQPQSRIPQETTVHEQARQRDSQRREDQAIFIKLFQTAVQRGTLQLKAFWYQAKASGISDEWFRVAIDSLPSDVKQSIMAQVNRSGPTLNTPPLTNAHQQQPSSVPSPVTSPPPLQTMMPAIQQAPKSGTNAEGKTQSAPGQNYGTYAAQLQYYAEQAMKPTITLEASDSTTSGNIAAMETTPRRDVPQVHANTRTPKDANKSTLARDILRSLGKSAPNIRREIGAESTDKTNVGQLLVADSQPLADVVPPESPAVQVTSLSNTNSVLVPLEKPGARDESQRVGLSVAKTVLKEEYGHATVTERPILIDLTLEDSDDSIGGKGQEEPILTSPATSPQPVSLVNTTNHTPLLKNLSLEEPPADVAAGANKLDVRMVSPPVPLAAEENVESELVYPPPRDSEPVMPSFERPCEASGPPPGNQLPLFLPSPPVSPSHTEPPETVLETIISGGEDRPPLKRRSIDTEVVVPPRANKRQRQRVYVLVPPAPSYVKKANQKKKEGAMVDGGSTEGVEDEEIQYSRLEQVLINESKSRLLERRCQWLNCDAILNCAVNLLTHLKDHVREEDLQAPFFCRWASCQRQFAVEQERDVHLEKHTIRPLPCPFSGCDEQFDKPLEIMQHEVQHRNAEHREALRRKPTCQPTVPAIPARLGPPPQWLPSHRVIPRRVVKCQISADRHATLGPWVLWNIFSPVDLNPRKQNASMRRSTRQAISYDDDGEDAQRDDYDFLQALWSYPAKNPQLDDLDSDVITMSAASGLTLWGSGPYANSAAGSATHAVSLESALSTAGDAGEACVCEQGQSVVTGEEDAVERMLIL